jgi:Fur family ferric uptake transcriptional regulator
MRRAARKRTTRQLEQVFKALQGDHTHPFAHEIYQRVHKKLPRISLATVYRNLHSLVDEGKIRTLLLDAQGARFDPETSQQVGPVARCWKPARVGTQGMSATH